MADQLYTMDGSEIYIGTNPVNSKSEVELSDFAGVSWIKVNGLYNLGELGGDQTINEFELLGEDWMRKIKSTRNGGTMTNQFIPMALDPGQQKIIEAIENKCRPYPIKVERGSDCAPESDVTITIANPGVITWTSHGFVAGQPIVFSTTGSLPTGLTAGITYYVVAAGLATDSFSVAATPGGTPITTSSTQSGTHTAVAPPAGMTDLFYALITDGARSGGGKNDLYLRTYNFAVDGRILTV